jgi:hypothetical protein
MRVFLELLGKPDCLFDVQKPSLSSLLVLARVNLFVRLLNCKIKELLLHIKCHVLFFYYF